MLGKAVSDVIFGMCFLFNVSALQDLPNASRTWFDEWKKLHPAYLEGSGTKGWWKSLFWLHAALIFGMFFV